jgi:hypothetical protein
VARLLSHGKAVPLVVLLGAVLAAGCGPGGGPRRYRVRGTVTYQGDPIPAGMVVFEPDTSQGNSGPQGFAPLVDGRYDTAAGGRGAVGGPHLVRITGFDGVPLDDDAPSGQPLFNVYETTVDLPEESMTLDFDLPGPESEAMEMEGEAGEFP